MSDEGEDSPPRPKRKIKKVMVLSSASESDSDDSVTAIGTRRKRMRVVSDAESVGSSGSSVVAGTRRRRALPRVPDSEADSDTSGWASEGATSMPAQAPKPSSGFASDSSEGNSDKCSICLLRFTTQEVGTPQSCEHIFCLDCITEWSKNVNTCPVDRMTFDFIVVRACAGGRVLRTEPVKVAERRSSVDLLVVEDPTVCEVCRSTDNEETMLLCDGCDLGYHMHCLTPPLLEVPINQWLCPDCDDLLDVIHLSEVDDLFSGIVDMEVPMGPRMAPLREPRNVRRSSRQLNSLEEPSTSTGQRGNTENRHELPTTSRGTGSRMSHRTNSRSASGRRKTTTTHQTRRKYKRRRTKTVVIEYEVEENGKFPITRTVKRKIKRRKVKRRQPRTAARRSHVRHSVRARLHAQREGALREGARDSLSCGSAAPLALRRRHAGIPSLSLFGNASQLDYFSDEEHDVYGPSDTAVAIRPTSSILSAHRQARRKMIAIPSPTHASSAPDVLSSILESQTLLHSKNSVVSITIDGNVNIKLESRESGLKGEKSKSKKDNKVDLTKGEDATRKVPSYPGQSRGGGWGGGYRGNYHREQNSNNFSRGGYSNENSYGGGYQNRQGNPYMQNNNMRRDEGDTVQYNNYSRRPNQYTHNDDSPFERNRRYSEQGRIPNPPLIVRPDEPGRHSIGPSWQPYGGPRLEPPYQQQRHSFGGFENPLDMRMETMPHNTVNRNLNAFSGLQAPREEKPHTQGYRPLPEPPLFKFDKMPEMDKSEDERSDSGLIIDTEKYDPTEPTHDDDSGDEDEGRGVEAALPEPAAPAMTSAPPVLAAPLAPSPQPTLTVPHTHDPVDSILAGIDTGTINVPHNVLDNAVRLVLKEHRDLIAHPNIQSQNDKSDNESDGDCPNFSIYSATSVHIANNTSSLNFETPVAVRHDSMEDLVQEDDDVLSPSLSPALTDTEAALEKSHKNDTSISKQSIESTIKKKSEEEYKEKVSKRCPITTNTRNPIKIKLNTPSLIKRQVTLYDEEDDADEETEEMEQDLKTENVPKQSEVDVRSREESPQSQKVNTKPLEEPIEVNLEESALEKDNGNNSLNDLVQKSNSNNLAHINDNQVETTIKEDGTQPEDNIESVDSDLNDKKEISTSLVNEVSSENKGQSDEDNEEMSEIEDENLRIPLYSPKKSIEDRNEDVLDKMTESVSETEDERSYTPCLDENKSKDTSLETEKEKGIEGLDTEMISEDEGNEMFSDNEKARSEKSNVSPERVLAGADGEEGEILDKKKEKTEEGKKKKKKDSKKEGKEKGKKKKGDVSFKKLSRSGKERNYRERDKEEKGKKREKREPSDGGEREKQKQKRKEKRKDLERYDVRSVVTEKRRKPKDPFGRDISPRVRSRSPSISRSPAAARSRSVSREHRSQSRVRASPLRLPRSLSRLQRSPSPLPRGRRSVSKGRRSPSPLGRPRRSPSPLGRLRRSPSPLGRPRRSLSPIGRPRRSPSPIGRLRRSPSPLGRPRRSPSPIGRLRRSPSRGRGTPVRGRRSPSRSRLSPFRARRTASPVRIYRNSLSPPVRRARPSPSPRSPSLRGASLRRSMSPRRRRRPSITRGKRAEARRRRSTSRRRKRRRSASGSRSPKPKKKKRARSERPASRRRSPRKKSPKRRRAKRRSESREPEPSPPPPRNTLPPPEPEPTPAVWSGGSVDSRLLSPRTPPPEEVRRERRRRDPERARHRRVRDTTGPSKEVFTSGDNILVSVSFKDQERLEGEQRKERRREKRRRRRRAPAGDADTNAAKPVAIIDLERSPFRELTPSPKNVIVLSDSEPGEKEGATGGTGVEAGPGPQTPPSPAAATPPACVAPAAPPDEPRGPNTPPDPPDSPDAYDPYEPTRSASASPLPARAPASPARPLMTLEAAQKTNMSADEVLDRRPLSPIEKVMALLQSTRDISPDPPPGDAPLGEIPPGGEVAPVAAAQAQPPAPRILLPEASRPQPPKLFLAKPSPIKSDPIKPMQAVKIARPPPAALARRREEPELEGGDSPYSPGSSDFGDLFEPPLGRRDAFDALFERHPRRRKRHNNAKVPVRLDKKKGKTQVDVKIDEDNLKILDELPSSAVEMQVKSKFLKKLNRQERVVEEVKLVLKPHYNKKHVTKEEYKDVLRRAVPKICHNKSGEINPSKIQALVEAYVKKIRKKHKLGLV
ncbi:hypothetical protein K1T71_001027 [Dendrolimus kikuchii]|uniref:Uncharacterized protein n=1 Tax=Dendrolimus kikuchii TaxID=765133 RepID=A0ACC1DGS0_9NEOP|nr:hypothetical protein K1T71_001027 [Dendrolimus kikuchii]